MVVFVCPLLYMFNFVTVLYIVLLVLIFMLLHSWLNKLID